MSIKANTGDAVACVQQSYRDISVASALEEEAWEEEDPNEYLLVGRTHIIREDQGASSSLVGCRNKAD